ncbi:hypothetical protein ACWIUD_04115 [Helicobacter sp. 23-1044]
MDCHDLTLSSLAMTRKIAESALKNILDSAFFVLDSVKCVLDSAFYVRFCEIAESTRFYRPYRSTKIFILFALTTTYSSFVPLNLYPPFAL